MKLFKKNSQFYKSLFLLSMPLILQNLVNSSLGLVDTVMVGMIGQDELAGLTLANTPFFIAMLFVFGIQSGGSVLISQYWGKKDMVAINRVMGLSFFFAGAVSFIFATIIFLFPEAVMGLTTNNPDLIETAVSYGRIVSYSYFINSVVMVYVGAQRSIENPKFGMIVLVFSMIFNTFGNWVLIFGKLGFPALGVRGAAISTLLARVLELIITIIYILFVDKHLVFIPKALIRPGKAMFQDFIKYASPVIANEALWGFGTSIFPVIFGHMQNSSDIIAAYSISGNIERIVAVATFGLANAAAIMIGKSIGAGGERDEIQSIGGEILKISTIVGFLSGAILIALTFFIVEPYVFSLFNLSQNAREISKVMMVTIGIFLTLRAFNSANIVGVTRGGGDVNFCMLLDVLPLYLYAIPVAAVTGLILQWDIKMVYILMMFQEFIKFTFGFWRFKSKKWINNITREAVANE